MKGATRQSAFHEAGVDSGDKLKPYGGAAFKLPDFLTPMRQ
jgi:hypothetical protein